MARMHFIGVCGTAMATLAAMLKGRGHDVQGSDQAMYPPMSDFLVRESIRVFSGFDARNITPELDLVVVGNAISRGNVELEEVLDRKIRHRSLPETIREHFLWEARSIVLAGTHGKTTTTALTGWLLAHAERDPSVLVGGIVLDFGGSYRLGSGRDFVIEGDEYDSAFFDKTAKFLKYLPDIAVVGNLEYDHADIYPDMESLRTAFRRFLNLVPRSGRVILGAESPEAMALAPAARADVETFGVDVAEATWRATNIGPRDGRMGFDIWYRGDLFAEIRLPLHGLHNVRNAVAAAAAAHAAGLGGTEIARGLASFSGVKRRLELRGDVRGVSVFDDFAHHPTAIRETVRAMRASFPDRRIWAVFEPRSATSCRRIFQDDFARAFIESGADEVVLAAVFRSSLPEAERLDVDALSAAVSAEGPRARVIPHADEIARTIAAEAREGDLVIVMSNGGFDDVHGKLLEALGRS
jgi:UDP-N-acetylmuramate: L-alanyl-gamma-D-glutamyl-meso-diaminopimelate ligase